MPDFRDEIGRDGLLCSAKFQLVDLLRRFRRGKAGESIDSKTLHAHVTRHRIQTRTVTTRTVVRFTFVDPFRFTLCRQLILQNRIAIVALAGLQFLIPNFAKSAALFAGAVRRIE